MRENIKGFFLSLKEPSFLAMKLLLEVFNKFDDDEYSKRIVDNITNLTSYEIRLMNTKDSSNYVFVSDELKRVEFGIANSCTETIMCHEFGHLLLDLFAEGELPDDFEQINLLCKERINKKRKYVSSLLENYRIDTYKKLIVDRDEVMDFCDKNSEVRELYFLEHPENDEDDFKDDLLMEHYELVSAMDNNIDNYNRVANVIDAIYHGNNPFEDEYGNNDIDPVLAMHNSGYFESAYFGPLVMGFEEQFADYLVLRTFPNEMSEANKVLHELLGDEWFTMMDKFYDKVTSKIGNKDKVYHYK